MNLTLLHQANKNWEDFIDNLSEEEKKELVELREPISVNTLYYYAASKNNIKFDQTINTLSRRYLYDEEIIPLIYNFYIERGLDELAHDYLNNAALYIHEDGRNIPPNIQNMLDYCETANLLSKYKISLDRIRSLIPSNIPKISPDILNNKRQLNDFILNEIIQAGRVISDKREAIKQITHENRYNDYLQAILKLRFPFWGWSIQDQSRLGTSTGGADAGSADIVIQSGGGTNIALLEAFILHGKDYTQAHILKCPKYVSTINRFYVLVYFLEDRLNFNDRWENYKADVLSADYPEDFAIDSVIGFQNLINEYENVNDFKIEKTTHNSNIFMYHVMINLGSVR